LHFAARLISTTLKRRDAGAFFSLDLKRASGDFSRTENSRNRTSIFSKTEYTFAIKARKRSGMNIYRIKVAEKDSLWQDVWLVPARNLFDAVLKGRRKLAKDLGKGYELVSVEKIDAKWLA
jgi:hypothetical protein